MNITIGRPYEEAIRRIIDKEYAGNQTEVIRQAILAYERMIEEEELMLVHRGVSIEMVEALAGTTLLTSLDEVKRLITK
ncbi:hypothetical protein FTO68_07230 [Methanocalculus taiwanensis]|uniref:CopG family transcriptional regulator n=1 Tax=Methanocalculus taiwanensis TaxID=106207 RepID=A0ABD4TN98_9EURY|nr:hypothetical protein [Methanocalculus taiwanensis]MCQ1538775.1 hypothetical protein [Methanocalculus taiwanensis]